MREQFDRGNTSIAIQSVDQVEVHRRGYDRCLRVNAVLVTIIVVVTCLAGYLVATQKFAPTTVILNETTTKTMNPATVTKTATTTSTVIITVTGGEKLRETEAFIDVKAEGMILHYQNTSFWDEERFSEILNGYGVQFKRGAIERFNESLLKYGLYATGCEIKLDRPERSTLLKCDVCDAVSKSGNRYTAEFEWLLQPFELNLFDFNESDRELLCVTVLDSTATTFTLRFPASIGHCYYHVWWAMD